MSSSSRVFSCLLLVAAVAAGTLGLAPAANAAFSPTPAAITWTPDGPVHALVARGDRVYVGGAFTGGVAALDAASGALVWTAAVNGDVRALALSSDGSHVLAGGGFTAADGLAHRKLVSLRAVDGTAEPRWRGAAGGTVRDIVVVGDTVYFSGAFTKHAGVVQGGLGAVSAATGRVLPEFATSTDGKVFGLATNGTRLFLVGNFTAVDGQPRNQLASVTLAGHSLDGWRPAQACTGCGLMWDVTLGSGTVYTVGRNEGAVYAVDMVTGARHWRSTQTNGDAQALVLADGLLYVGGHFTITEGQRRPVLAAFDPATGALDAFSTRFVTTWPGVWALATDGARLYVGGAFTAVGPRPNRYPYFAVFGAL